MNEAYFFRLGQIKSNSPVQYVQLVSPDKNFILEVQKKHQLSDNSLQDDVTKKSIQRWAQRKEGDEMLYVLRMTKEEYGKIIQSQQLNAPSVADLEDELNKTLKILLNFKEKMNRYRCDHANKAIVEEQKNLFYLVDDVLALDDFGLYRVHPCVALKILQKKIDELLTQAHAQKMKIDTYENEKKERKNAANNTGSFLGKGAAKFGSLLESVSEFNTGYNKNKTQITSLCLLLEDWKALLNQKIESTSTPKKPSVIASLSYEESVSIDSVVINAALQSMYFLYKKLLLLTAATKNNAMKNLMHKDAIKLHAYCNILANSLSLDFLDFSLEEEKAKQLNQLQYQVQATHENGEMQIKQHLDKTLQEVLDLKKSLNADFSFPDALKAVPQLTNIAVDWVGYDFAYQNPEVFDDAPEAEVKKTPQSSVVTAPMIVTKPLSSNNTPIKLSDADFTAARYELFHVITFAYFLITALSEKTGFSSLSSMANELLRFRKSLASYHPRMVDVYQMTMEISNSQILNEFQDEMTKHNQSEVVLRYFEIFKQSIAELHASFKTKYSWNQSDYIPGALYNELSLMNKAMVNIDIKNEFEKGRQQKRISFEAWLKAKYKVFAKVENTQKLFGLYQEAGVNFIFDDLEGLKNFKNDLDFGAHESYDPSQEIEYFRDPIHADKFALYIGQSEYDKIKEAYETDNRLQSKLRSSAEIQNQIMMLQTRQIFLKEVSQDVVSRLDLLQTLASNKGTTGTYKSISSSAFEMSIQNYLALK